MNGLAGYDASVNPQIDHMFQTAAMRFGHTLVLSGKIMVFQRPRIFWMRWDNTTLKSDLGIT